MVRPGWRGDSYRHYLAAKGVKTTPEKHIYNSDKRVYNSEAYDILSKSFRKAEKARSDRIEAYTGNTPNPALLKEYSRLGTLQSTTRDPLDEKEAIQVEEKVAAEREFLRQKARFSALPRSTRGLSSPGEVDRTLGEVTEYENDLRRELNRYSKISGFAKESSDAANKKYVRDEENRLNKLAAVQAARAKASQEGKDTKVYEVQISQLSQVGDRPQRATQFDERNFKIKSDVENMELKLKRTQNLKEKLTDLKSGRLTISSFAADPSATRTLREIKGPMR